MYGQNSDRSSKCLNAATLAIALTLSAVVGCASTSSKPCDQSSNKTTLQAVRSSGGVAVTSAQYRIGGNELAYGAAELRCAALDSIAAASIQEALRAPRLHGILSEVAAKQYREKYSDLPHVVLEIGRGPVFIPANLLVESELGKLLQPVDDLFRLKFGRRYRLPLLPTPAEGRDLQQLWSMMNNHRLD
jgi:hypothetical protein